MRSFGNLSWSEIKKCPLGSFFKNYFENELPIGLTNPHQEKQRIAYISCSEILSDWLEKGKHTEEEIIDKYNQMISFYFDYIEDAYEYWLANEFGFEEQIYFLTKIAENLEETDKDILDFGCGSGLDLAAFATLFPKRRFFGYDRSKIQLNLANDRIKRLGLENVFLFAGDHGKIPFRNQSIDLVISKCCQTGYMFLEDYYLQTSLMRLEKGIFHEELRRILKDSGSYVEIIGSPVGQPKNLSKPGWNMVDEVSFPEGVWCGKPFHIAGIHKKNHEKN